MRLNDPEHGRVTLVGPTVHVGTITVDIDGRFAPTDPDEERTHA